MEMTKEKISIREVLDIISHSEDSLKEKIPQDFIEYLTENTDLSYETNIDFDNDNWEENISEDTDILLSYIYTNFLCSDEEKNRLNTINETVLSERYNVDNLFKNRKNDSNMNNNSSVENNNEETALIETPKVNIFKRLINALKNIFIKK